MHNRDGRPTYAINFLKLRRGGATRCLRKPVALLNVVFVVVCLAGMTLIVRHWFALSQNMFEDAQANRIGRDIHWRIPGTKDLS